MKHLKLIINNENKKKEIFFHKNELQLILNLYARMVSSGDWKDYEITKSLKPRNESEKYLVKNSQNKIISSSDNLGRLIGKIIWKKLKLVN